MFYQILTFFATPVFAQDDYGLSTTAGAAELTKFGTNLPQLIGNVLGTALSLVGVLFFALMLYGGISWMVARGNAEQEKKALNTITAAIIGIVVVLGSYAITKFVFSAIQGAGSDSNSKGSVEIKVCSARTGVNVLDMCGTFCVATLPPTVACNGEAPADNVWCNKLCTNDCKAENKGAWDNYCNALQDETICNTPPNNTLCIWK